MLDETQIHFIWQYDESQVTAIRSSSFTIDLSDETGIRMHAESSWEMSYGENKGGLLFTRLGSGAIVEKKKKWAKKFHKEVSVTGIKTKVISLRELLGHLTNRCFFSLSRKTPRRVFLWMYS